MDKYIGKRLDGRYEIKEILGMGGMAVVYKAYDNIEDRIVAVKILKEEFSENEEFLRRFRNESKAVALLSHPNIVKIFDVSFGDLIQYIVMEYIEGITLKEYIEQQGSLSWKDAVHFTIQILRGLQHAHDKGIVHRDVKPQNIMLLPDRTIKMTDFGIARFARNEHQTMTDKAIGSVHYISPEQAKGEPTDEKADIYSVGVMMYEMLTGQVPFTSKSAVSVAIMQLQTDPKMPTDVNPDIPQGLEDITMHAMQKVASHRYKTAAEMLHDLEEFKRSPGITFDYSYFVDDSPTKFIPGEGIVDEAEEDEEDEEQRSPVVPILAGIASALIVGLVVLGIIFVPKLLSNTGTEIVVPNFVGQTIEQINQNPAYEAFEFTPIYEQNEVPYGQIYQQDPQEGATRKKNNGQVTLWISLGSKKLVVPNVYGKTIAAGASDLVASNIKYEIIEIPDDTVPKDHIIKTSPERGEEIAANDTLKVYQSTGPATIFTKVPRLISLSEADAKKEIERNGFSLGEIYTIDNSFYPAGTVVEQSLGAGEEYGKGSVIDIGISSGLFKYSYDLKIPLTKEFSSATYALDIEVWKAGVKKETFTATVDSSKLKEYVQKINLEGTATELDTLTVKVKIREESEKVGVDYYEFEVDVVAGTIASRTELWQPPEEEPSSQPVSSIPENIEVDNVVSNDTDSSETVSDTVTSEVTNP